MQFHWFLLAALSLASNPLVGAEDSNAESVAPPGIVNGQPASAGEFPYQIALLVGEQLLCGGSIIKPNAVLTAAHCVVRFLKRPTALSVRYGTIDRENGPVVKVSKITYHPRYRGVARLGYDVAVLKLAEDILPSDGAGAIELETELPGTGDNLLLAGWGRDQSGATPLWLQKADTLRYVNVSECQASWKIGFQNRQTMLCSRSDQQSGCHGDSGGPLVNPATGKQVGIVSWGEKSCSVGGKPNVYASVPALAEWIEQASA